METFDMATRTRLAEIERSKRNSMKQKLLGAQLAVA